MAYTNRGITAKLDSATNSWQTIDYAHHEIHSGSGYFAIRSELVDTAGDVEVRFATPNTTKWAHMTITVESSLAATVSLWAGTTKTHESGNAIVPLNRDFNSSNVSGLTICHTPGGSQAGTANLIQYIGATATGGRVNEGGSSNSRHEFILAQNTAYYILATSRADSNAISIILDWYEHTNN